ncbi:gamma-glutamyl hydrolase A-like isoform X1 [Macrosteles quadrilineatus]|uniref:gamma-glutamyl hydrolase A-like isoform X1 n=2 Tax=Macrosteles quadrilineatus TaxID=74068 RepID=UPI0023E12997|nr:gamma-glutamyl hydrolase A-like isoform X1 [Macrosteles quadrilineatus]
MVLRNMMLFLSTVILHFGLSLATERPIIGIVTEEVSSKAQVDARSMIAASYVKAVEQAGARAVPIFINKTASYYRHILDAINGVVLPGGAVSFNSSGGYADVGRIIMEYTKEVNSNGDIFPVLGVCLGFELLLYLEVESYSILVNCNSSNVALPLVFKNKYQRSKLYYRAPTEVIEILSTLPVTYNQHRKCVTEQLLAQHNLTDTWHVLTTSYDVNRKEFISSIEHRGLPVAGIQFHPEKNAFEWNPTERIVHSHKAVVSARHFYDWLVGEARKNNHYFKNPTKETEALIYNYSPTFVDKGAGYFEQVYYFQ